MYFIVGLPKTAKRSNLIWAVVDRLTKSAYFVLIKINYPLQKLAQIYISEIVKLQKIPPSIVSYRDLRFMSRFWEIL